MISVGVDDNAQDSTGAGYPGGQREACPHVMAAIPLLDIDDTIRRVDGIDETPEGRGAFRGLLDQPRDRRVAVVTHARDLRSATGGDPMWNPDHRPRNNNSLDTHVEHARSGVQRHGVSPHRTGSSSVLPVEAEAKAEMGHTIDNERKSTNEAADGSERRSGATA
jgi:hypothetical protein